MENIRETVQIHIKYGDALDLEGQTEKAEQEFMIALKMAEELLCTGDSQYVSLMKEICLRLADLNMQQGNMHGADVYYVKALYYSKRKF